MNKSFGRSESLSSLLFYRSSNRVGALVILSSLLLFSSLSLSFDNISDVTGHVFAQASVNDITTDEFLTYNNSTTGISIQYPSNFEIIESGKSVAFHTPLEEGEQVFSEQVGIITVDDSGSAAPSGGGDDASVNDYLQVQFNNFIHSYPDYLLVEGPIDTSINGNPAKSAVFTTTLSDNTTQRTMEMWIIDQSSGKLFQIEASVLEAKYPEFPPAHIQRMIDSLEITPSQAKQQQQPLSQQESITNNTAVATTTESTVLPTNNFLTYENNTYAIRINHPADWTYYGTAESGGFIDIVGFQAPLEGRADPSSALFIVSRDSLPSDRSMSLKEYVDMIINDYKLSDPNFKVVESSTDGSTSLLGGPAYKIVSTTILDGIPYKTLEIGTIIGNKVYLVTYDAEEAEFSKHLPLAHDMINSFQLVGLSGNDISAGLSDTMLGNATFGKNDTADSNTNTTVTNQTAIPSSSLVNYQNNTYGIQKMQYPSNWEKQERVGDVMFLSPLESSADTLREGLQIILQSIPSEGMNLNNFVNSTLGSLMQASSDLEIVNSYPTNLANSIPAHRVEYTWTNLQNNIEMKTMDVYAITNGKSYIVSYGAPIEKYELYLPVIQSMISSLIL